MDSLRAARQGEARPEPQNRHFDHTIHIYIIKTHVHVVQRTVINYCGSLSVAVTFQGCRLSFVLGNFSNRHSSQLWLGYSVLSAVDRELLYLAVSRPVTPVGIKSTNLAVYHLSSSVPGFFQPQREVAVCSSSFLCASRVTRREARKRQSCHSCSGKHVRSARGSDCEYNAVTGSSPDQKITHKLTTGVQTQPRASKNAHPSIV